MGHGGVGWGGVGQGRVGQGEAGLGEVGWGRMNEQGGVGVGAGRIVRVQGCVRLVESGWVTSRKLGQISLA